MASSCEPVEIVQPSETRVTVKIGETPVGIVTYRQGVAPFAFSFLNVHNNENTSVVAAKSLIAGGSFGSASITFLDHGGTRDVAFEMGGGRAFSIDPNRMFTAAGRRQFLEPRWEEDADAAVAEFAGRVLEEYGFFNVSVALTLHNNGPGYSASSYLPGGEFAAAAQAVAIGKLFSPRNFFYVVPGNVTTAVYACLAKSGLNAVLQVAQQPPDDGSLSVLAAAYNISYINTEGAAEDGGEGARVVDQLINLKALAQILQGTRK